MENVIYVPISYGELIDKITMPEIKLEIIENNDNIQKELLLLQDVYENIEWKESITEKRDQLLNINKELWNVEDLLREETERDKIIDLAKSIQRLNDARFFIKREINIVMESDIIEEKSFV